MTRTDLVETLAALVRINSVNSAYAGGPGEGELAAWLIAFCQERGLPYWEQPVFPGRSNVIIRLAGKNPQRRLIYEAHMDTVSVQGMTIPPFDPRIEGNLMYGRGACDTKAGLAGMLCALADVHAEGVRPPCDVWLAAVVDEEFSFRGVVKLCEELDNGVPDGPGVRDASTLAAIVAEPTEMRVVIASKGVLRWRIKVQGKSAHSSKPHLGVNAIAHMARIILAVEEDNRRLARHEHPLLGPATCNVGIISGGVQVNFVPDECVIELDRRLLPGESAEETLARYQRLIDELAGQEPTLQARLEPPMLCDEALSTPADSAPAQLAADVLKGLGLNPAPCGVPFGSDASKLSRQGVPSLIFGPGSIDRAHAAVEYVELDQVRQAAEFYRAFLLRFE